MANSLRAKITKLRHDRKITEEEYAGIISKLYGHDMQIRTDVIDELLNNVSESIIWDILAEIMKRNISASEGTDKIIDYLQKLAEQLKEKSND